MLEIHRDDIELITEIIGLICHALNCLKLPQTATLRIQTNMQRLLLLSSIDKVL